MADGTKGIIFSPLMVRALLDGRKTQTRRLLRNPEFYGCPTGDCPHNLQSECDAAMAALSPKEKGYAVGDRLYVRENFSLFADDYGWDDYHERQGCHPDETIVYAADRAGGVMVDSRQWRPPSNAKRSINGTVGHDETWTEIGIIPCIYMPRWASRLWLEVSDVRVQRLNDMTEADALAEGVTPHENGGFWVPGVEHPNKDFPYLSRSDAKGMFAALWDTIHGSGEWLANPWIVAVSFSVHHGSIDAGRS